MIPTTPGVSTTATLEGAPAGLTITARLRDGDEILPTVVTISPKLDATGDPLDAYVGVFTAPAQLPVMLEWLQDEMVVGSELVVLRTIPQTGTDAEATARERLEQLLAPSMEPVLTEADIDSLMIMARTIDVNGLGPSEDGWIPTWSMSGLWAAVSLGWEIRAGRCFGDIDFAEDGQRFDASGRFEQCMKMAALYRRGTSSVGVGSGYARVPSIVSPDAA
jgi:hypothetical protein